MLNCFCNFSLILAKLLVTQVDLSLYIKNLCLFGLHFFNFVYELRKYQIQILLFLVKYTFDIFLFGLHFY